MPQGDGTGPAGGGGRGRGRAGQGQGQGFGQGQSQGAPRGRMGGFAAGPGGGCVCTSCGKTIAHQRGVPCMQMTCPDCGAAMTRSQ